MSSHIAGVAVIGTAIASKGDSVGVITGKAVSVAQIVSPQVISGQTKSAVRTIGTLITAR